MTRQGASDQTGFPTRRRHVSIGAALASLIAIVVACTSVPRIPLTDDNLSLIAGRYEGTWHDGANAGEIRMTINVEEVKDRPKFANGSYVWHTPWGTFSGVMSGGPENGRLVLRYGVDSTYELDVQHGEGKTVLDGIARGRNYTRSIRLTKQR